MPSGIVPELIIVLILVLAIGAAVAVSRRRRDRIITEEPPPAAPPPTEEVAVPPEEELAVEAPPEEVVGVEAPIEEKVRPSLRERLAKSRRFLTTRINEALGGGVSAETWDDLEAALIQADIGVETATEIVQDLKDEARERGATDEDGLRALLVEELTAMFDLNKDRGLMFARDRPTVWLIMGVNGTGKTTTIGKLARDLANHDRKVTLAAADTFRAAADEQLQIWAERADARLVRHRQGADPGAVTFDAYEHARATGADVLMVDTAGRLHTKVPLMDELAKIRRVIEKAGHVDEGLLVIDATSGQNGLAQARQFAEKAGVTGIALTKLDGTAKGGIALTIERELGIPIKLIGVGEGVDDLEPFDPKTFVQALLS